MNTAHPWLHLVHSVTSVSTPSSSSRFQLNSSRHQLSQYPDRTKEKKLNGAMSVLFCFCLIKHMCCLCINLCSSQRTQNLKSSCSFISLFLAGFFCLFVCFSDFQIINASLFPAAAFSQGPSSLDISLMNNYKLVSSPPPFFRYIIKKKLFCFFF